MALPTITPTVLGIVAQKDTPSDSEAANLLGQYEVQIKNFLASFLALVFSDDDQPVLKAEAFSSTVLADAVGTDALANGAVTAAKIADGVVTGGPAGSGVKIAAVTITADNIVGGTITGAKIASNTVAGINIVAGDIDTAQLHDSAVTTNKIADGDVTDNKLAPDAISVANAPTVVVANAIPLAKLAVGSVAGKLLVVDDGSPKKVVEVAMNGDATMDYTGLVTLKLSGVAELEERASLNVPGGTSVATSWNPRGVAVGWTKIFDTVTTGFGMVSVISSHEEIVISAPGTYLITASAPAYCSELHQLAVVKYTGTPTSPSFSETIRGSSETAPATALTQSRSYVSGILNWTGEGFFKVMHYITAAQVDNGLGVIVNAPAISSEPGYQIYAQVKVQRIA